MLAIIGRVGGRDFRFLTTLRCVRNDRGRALGMTEKGVRDDRERALGMTEKGVRDDRGEGAGNDRERTFLKEHNDDLDAIALRTRCFLHARGENVLISIV